MSKRRSKGSARSSDHAPRARHGSATRAADRSSDVLIRDLLRTPTRYLRSVHLERDFDDAGALQDYVVTPAMATAFYRVLEGLRPGSGRRAWRVTGDYGSGKSSFALALAHLMRDPNNSALSRLRKAVDLRGFGVRGSRVLPVLVTGAREGLATAIARAVHRTAEQLRGRGRAPKTLLAIAELAADVEQHGDVGTLLRLLRLLTAYAVGAGHSGVLLVLDELGKFLEYAALHPDHEDVYALQRLAEMASRSGEEPLILLALLHQGFHAYAERLPSTTRHEWEKVAERFDELVFDQPLAHTAALVAGALNVATPRLPAAIHRRARAITKAVGATGWYASVASGSRSTEMSQSVDAVDALSVYPLHPTVLPVLVRFFARFGQHERSLFGFLLSSEPFALQTFAGQHATGEVWYRLSDFYDYVRAVFGHRLAGASYRSQWLRIAGVVDGAVGLTALELRVLKTVAVLNLLDAEHLLATDAVLVASIADGDGTNVTRAMGALKKRGMLFHRGAAGGYCLWPTTSVNIDAAFEAAKRALGPVDSVASHVGAYLDARPLLARRHSILTGTLRFFEVRYSELASVKAAVSEPTDADGVVVVALCDTSVQRFHAEGIATTPEIAARPDVLITVSQPLQGIAAELQDARAWQWVADNTPELTHDGYAAVEVARQVAAARRTLSTRLAEFTGLQTGGGANATPGANVMWMRAGQPVEVPVGRALLSVLSDICDAVYDQAPRIRNELLNRRTLSSAASAARMRLVERMFTSADQPLLGIDASKAPPEKSMYLSVLHAGRVHRAVDSHFVLGEPPLVDDPLRLRPALMRVMSLLEESDGHRVPVGTLLAALRSRPFGVRAGVSPLLLAIVATAHAHELAVYENGTFLQRVGPSDFLRLIKLPTAFEFQLCKVTGVRTEVFNRLADAFATTHRRQRRAELLDVVTPLCVFAAELPEFTRRAVEIPVTARAVRDALLSAREPGPLLFHELPLACEVGAFSPDEPADVRRVQTFVSALKAAMDDLRATYPQLLVRIASRVTTALGEVSAMNALSSTRAHLAERAGRVSLAAREPRLRAFAHRLADVALADDAWAEALGSFVLSRPPNRWAPGDEARVFDEIEILAATFRRVEAIAFSANDQLGESRAAMRVGLTRADGVEAAFVIHPRHHDEVAILGAASQLRALLPGDDSARLAVLTQLLWREMDRMRIDAAPDTAETTTQGEEHSPKEAACRSV